MSFNPVGNGKAPAGQDEPVGAFEVSKIKRIGQYSCSREVQSMTDGRGMQFRSLSPLFIAFLPLESYLAMQP